jgi:hypothetical protein
MDRPSAAAVAGAAAGAVAVAAADAVAAVDAVAAAVFEAVAGGVPVVAAAVVFVPAAEPGAAAVDGVGVVVIVLMAPLLKQSEGDLTLGSRDCLDHGATQKRKAEAMKSGKLDSSSVGIELRSSSPHLMLLMQCR